MNNGYVHLRTLLTGLPPARDLTAWVRTNQLCLAVHAAPPMASRDGPVGASRMHAGTPNRHNRRLKAQRPNPGGLQCSIPGCGRCRMRNTVQPNQASLPHPQPPARSEARPALRLLETVHQKCWIQNQSPRVNPTKLGKQTTPELCKQELPLLSVLLPLPLAETVFCGPMHGKGGL